MIATATLCNTCGGVLDPSRNHGRCATCLFAEALGDAGENGGLGMISGHELIEEIARGGMGVVYRARQREPERVVALKTLRGADLESPAAIVRFRQEAKAMADLEHSAILPVFAFGEQDGIPYFTMKLATGGTLAQRLGSYAGKWREIAELLARVADAVQHAHTHAVLHRDLKPANILFDESDRAFVSDFGLAKLLDSTDAPLTHTAAVMGTPHYLAPEIAAHDTRAATTATDVWSLGVILYELLAQRLPFDGDSIPAVLRAITDTKPAPLGGRSRSGDIPVAVAKRAEGGLFGRWGEKRSRCAPGATATGMSPLPGPPPRDLAIIVAKALAKEPARRYGSAREMAEDLRRWLGGRPILARPASPLEKLLLGARRNPRLAAATALAAMLLVVGVAGITIQWRRAESAERATRERLAHAHIRAGLHMAENGDMLRGLPHYVEALRLGLGDPARERVARLRFEMTVRQSPRLAQLWLPEGVGDIHFADESGRVVISAGPETRVWDAAGGAAVSPPMSHAAEVRRVWSDPLGSRVVIGTRDDQITVWDAATGAALATRSGEGHVRAVLGGPRLRLAALDRGAHTVRCISALDGAVDATFSHLFRIYWAVTSPDGTRVLAATKSSLLLWDIDSGALVVPPLDFGGEPDFGNFDPSGHLVGLRMKHEDGIALFDLRTGAITARGATKSIGSLRHGWLDGTRWVVLARKFAGSALREGATDRLLFDVPIGTGTVAADFATGRNFFVLAGENGASQIWDADIAQPLTPRLWAAGRPDTVRLSADGTTFLTSSGEPAVRAWKLPPHGGAMWSATETAPALAVWWRSGRLLAVGADGRLVARDADTGRAADPPVVLDAAATCAVPDVTGRLVFVGGTHGARLWSAASGQPAGPWIPCEAAVRGVALSGDGRRAAVLLENTVLVCDPASGAIPHTLPHWAARRCVLNADGSRLVTLSKDAVKLWDTATGKPVGGAIGDDERWTEPGALFDPAGKRLSVWWSWPPTLPGRVRVIDAVTGTEALPWLSHPTAVTQAAFSTDGDLLATATRDQRLSVWRMSDGLPAIAPIAHDSWINSVGFSPDGLLVWSRSGRILRTWETATGDAASPALRHRGPPPPEPQRTASGAVATEDEEEVKIAWSTDSLVASSDSSGGVNVWDFRIGSRPLEEMEAQARILSTHRIEPGGGLVPLTREELAAAWAATRQK